jgi:hypothetical protein
MSRSLTEALEGAVFTCGKCKCDGRVAFCQKVITGPKVPGQVDDSETEMLTTRFFSRRLAFGNIPVNVIEPPACAGRGASTSAANATTSTIQRRHIAHVVVAPRIDCQMPNRRAVFNRRRRQGGEEVVVKNKCASPFTEAEFEIRWGVGIDAPSELIDLGLLRGVVEKNGADLSFAGESLGQGREKSREALLASPATMLALREAILATGPVRPGRRSEKAEA